MGQSFVSFRSTARQSVSCAMPIFGKLSLQNHHHSSLRYILGVIIVSRSSSAGVCQPGSLSSQERVFLAHFPARSRPEGAAENQQHQLNSGCRRAIACYTEPDMRTLSPDLYTVGTLASSSSTSSTKAVQHATHYTMHSPQSRTVVESFSLKQVTVTLKNSPHILTATGKI